MADLGTFSWPNKSGNVPAFASLSVFPPAAASGNGALAIALDTHILYESDGSTWLPIASPGAALSVGTFDSGTPSANGAHIDSTALIMQSASGSVPGLVNLSTQTFAGTKTFTSPTLFADGSDTTPGVAFASEPNSGFYRAGTGDVVQMVDGVQVAEFLKVGSNVNIGFGPSGTVSPATTNPLSFQSSNAGSQFFQFNNASTASTSATIFQILNGTASTSNATEIGNNAYTLAGYLNGGSWLSATANQSQLNIMSESASGSIKFNVGGRTLATEAMNLSTTSLTLNKGWGILNISGSSSGVVTIQPQAAAGTYNFNLPTTAGTAGNVLTSQGGGSTAMTWEAVLTNPMTTGGDVIYGGSGGLPTRLANGSASTVLTSAGGTAAPTWSQVSLTAGVTGLLPIANGGTNANTATGGFNNLSPMTTGGDLIYGGASGVGTRLANGSSTQVLTSNGGTAAPSWQNVSIPGGVNAYNYLVNGAFDYWQAATSITAATSFNAYGPDQWYCVNSLGTSGVLTLSQTTGVTDGSIFGAQLKITTAPTAVQTNGCQLWQVLSNKASASLYNRTASFSVLIKALGNVTQVGIQFQYATTETKPTTPLGSEVIATVNSSGFAACTINGQALGTSQTMAGVVGIRIRIATVSSGNTYDLNNGFICEQAIINLGPTAAAFSRQYNDPAQELAACQYFYETNYSLGVVPGTSSAVGGAYWRAFGNGTAFLNRWTTSFKVTKRALPALTIYSDADGTPGAYCVDGSSHNSTGLATVVGLGNFWVEISPTGLTSATNHVFSYMWVADSRI